MCLLTIAKIAFPEGQWGSQPNPLPQLLPTVATSFKPQLRLRKTVGVHLKTPLDFGIADTFVQWTRSIASGLIVKHTLPAWPKRKQHTLTVVRKGTGVTRQLFALEFPIRTKP